MAQNPDTEPGTGSSVTVRPVRFTAHPAEFGRMLRGLGAVEVLAAEDHTVYRAESGRIVVRAVGPDDPYAGLTVLGFECADPEHVTLDSSFLSADGGGTPRTATAGDGLMITFEPPSVPAADADAEFDTDPATDPAADPAADPDGDPDGADEIPVGRPDAGLTIVPIWMTTEVSAAAGALASLGFVRRLSSDNGVWVDLAGSGDAHGLLAVHHEEADADIIMAFEYAGDLAELQARMRRYGVDCPIIDENYARTLRLPDPDNATEIWVNEAMRDTYGYQQG